MTSRAMAGTRAIIGLMADLPVRPSAFTGDSNIPWMWDITAENSATTGNLPAGPQVPATRNAQTRCPSPAAAGRNSDASIDPLSRLRELPGVTVARRELSNETLAR
jgi:hypothetical protein